MCEDDYKHNCRERMDQCKYLMVVHLLHWHFRFSIQGEEKYFPASCWHISLETILIQTFKGYKNQKDSQWTPWRDQ